MHSPTFPVFPLHNGHRRAGHETLTGRSTRTPIQAMPSAFSWPVLVPSALRAPAPLTFGVMPQCFLPSTKLATMASSALSPCRREVGFMPTLARRVSAVSFAFYRQTFGLRLSHDHGLCPGTSRRTVPSFTGTVASASPSASAPLCSSFALTNQASFKLAGITRRSSGHQYWPWLRHFLGQYWYPAHLRCSGAA